MTPPQHLLIANETYCHGTDRSFTYFPKLPTELRLNIWQLTLQHNRFLLVAIPSTDRNEEAYLTTNPLGNIVSGSEHAAIFHGPHQLSKLLRVNRESRYAALQFYRIHIPARFQSFQSSVPRTGVMYINPEWDFVQVSGCRHPHSYINFLHDLKAYDPNEVGLLNFALNANDLSRLYSKMDSVTEIPGGNNFVATLSQLQELIWCVKSANRRLITDRPLDAPGTVARFNYSMPIEACTPSFDLHPTDPRTIDQDLNYVLIGTQDPRRMIVQWKELMDKCGASPARPARQRILFTPERFDDEFPVYNTKTANEYLKYEEEDRLEFQRRQKRPSGRDLGKPRPVEGPEELVKINQSVAGFWLFPIEAVGPPGDSFRQSKVYYDMSDYPPELAVSYLF